MTECGDALNSLLLVASGWRSSLPTTAGKHSVKVNSGARLMSAAD
ncbi:hypothetical protein [[Phormidium] sp. ETS-05]|nr:hypothetical protein [[Phormidium] sp. ETS-05]